MSYNTSVEMPEAVLNSLPQPAAEIYEEAFNTALQQYKERKYRDNSTPEEVAHRRAWSAVTQKFEKTEEGWREI